MRKVFRTTTPLCVALALLGCPGAPSAPPGATGAPSGRPGGAASRPPAATPRPALATLRGTLLGPTAAVISNHGAKILSDHGASIIGHNGAGVISDNGGSVIGQNGGSIISQTKWRLAQAAEPLEPVAGAEVDAIDLAGRVVAQAVKSDAQGRFALGEVSPGAGPVTVRARYEAGGQPIVLSAIVHAGDDLRVDPATTLIAKAALDLARRDPAAAQALDPAALATAAAALAPTLSAPEAVAAAVLPSDASATVLAHVAGRLPATAQAGLPMAGPSPAPGGGPAAPASAAPNPAGPPPPSGDPLAPATSAPSPAPSQAPSWAPGGAPSPGASPSPAASSAPTTAPDAPWSVTSLAGIAQTGTADGTGAAARFNDPWGLAAGPAGLVVAEFGTNRLRKLATSGQATWWSGSGALGHADGAAGTASFTQPFGVDVGPDATAYVAAGRIRRVRADGLVDTLGGGFVFAAPGDVALAPDGKALYVADQNHHQIQRIDLTQVNTPTTTLAGDGTAGHADGVGSAARFQKPMGVAFGPGGDLYVTELGGNVVRRVTLAGQVTTIAGTGTPASADGPGATATLDKPWGIDADGEGGLVFTETGSHAVRRLAPDGAGGWRVTTLAGGGAGDAVGPGASARFDTPRGVVVRNGAIYVADSQNHQIKRLSRP